MSDAANMWFIDGETAARRPVRIEVIGKTFVLYEQQRRSETYFFGDLIYLGKERNSQVFGLEDGIKGRPKWKLGIRGDIPAELASLLPKPKQPLLSNVGMLIIAFLCLAIVYFAAA